jgi:hypothetical protein
VTSVGAPAAPAFRRVMFAVASVTCIDAYSLSSPYLREASLMPTRGAWREEREGKDWWGVDGADEDEFDGDGGAEPAYSSPRWSPSRLMRTGSCSGRTASASRASPCCACLLLLPPGGARASRCRRGASTSASQVARLACFFFVAPMQIAGKSAMWSEQ